MYVSEGFRLTYRWFIFKINWFYKKWFNSNRVYSLLTQQPNGQLQNNTSVYQQVQSTTCNIQSEIWNANIKNIKKIKQKTHVAKNKTQNVKYTVYIIKNNIKRGYYTKEGAAAVVQGNTRDPFEEQKNLNWQCLIGWITRQIQRVKWIRNQIIWSWIMHLIKH